jgi:hypothetical protein
MNTITKQGAWGLWWLCYVTIGIYSIIWFQRTNRELCALLNRPVPANGQWWSQFVPFFGAMSRRATARRLNEAHEMLGSPTRVAPWTFSTWSLWWFGSHTRYLQRRLNILHDVHAASSAAAAPAAV